MTAKELIDILQPEHGRTSCSDNNLCNGFYSAGGKRGDLGHGRCSRCMLLEILNGEEVPKDFVNLIDFI